MQASRDATLLKRDSDTGVFPVNIEKNFKNCLIYRTPPVTASVSSQFKLFTLCVLIDYPM